MKLDNEVIKGNWSESRLHGYGERKFDNGETYSGSWYFGKLDGQGEHSSNEMQYKGGFRNNKEQGKGKLINFV